MTPAHSSPKPFRAVLGREQLMGMMRDVPLQYKGRACLLCTTKAMYSPNSVPHCHSARTQASSWARSYHSCGTCGAQGEPAQAYAYTACRAVTNKVLLSGPEVLCLASNHRPGGLLASNRGNKIQLLPITLLLTLIRKKINQQLLSMNLYYSLN